MQGTMSWNHSARERADGEKRRTSRQSSCVKLPDVGVSPMYNTSSQKRAVSIQQPTLQLHGVKPHHLAADSKQQQLSINYLKRRAVAPNYTQWQRTKAPKYDSEEQPTTPAQQLFKIKGIVRNSKAQPLSKGIRSSKDTSSVTFAPPHTSGNLQRPKASTLPDCQKTDDVIRVGKQQAPFSRRIVRTDSVKTRKKPRKPPESPAVRLLKHRISKMHENIAWWTKRTEELELMNVTEWMRIKKIEEDNYLTVDSQLKPDCRFGGKLAALDMGRRHVLEARERTRRLQLEREQELKALQADADSLESKMEKHLKEIEKLIIFKEKTFPESSARLAELRKKADALRSNADTEVNNLKASMQLQVQVSREELMKRLDRIPYEAAQEAARSTNFIMHRIELENDSMRKQIVMFTEKKKQQTLHLETLQDRIKKLRMEMTALRDARLAPLAKYRTPCLPTDEVMLSFDRKKTPLPI